MHEALKQDWQAIIELQDSQHSLADRILAVEACEDDDKHLCIIVEAVPI